MVAPIGLVKFPRKRTMLFHQCVAPSTFSGEVFFPILEAFLQRSMTLFFGTSVLLYEDIPYAKIRSKQTARMGQ